MSDSINWNKIKSGNVRTIWAEIAPTISKELFNNKVAVVKNIHDAPLYDLMVCFRKDAQFMKKEYYLLGHFSDLAKTTGPPPGTNSDNLLKICSKTLKETIPETFIQRWSKGKSTIRVELYGMSKHIINWAVNNGDLVVDLTNPSAHLMKTVYIINEVVYVQKVHMEVEVNGAKIQHSVFDARIPIAVAYNKFPVNDKGVLGPAINNKVDTDADFFCVNEEPL